MHGLLASREVQEKPNYTEKHRSKRFVLSNKIASGTFPALTAYTYMLSRGST